MDNKYRKLIDRALSHRPTVIGVGVAAVVAAFLVLPTIGFELMPQADEGEVSVTAELPVGTRIERAQDVALRSKRCSRTSAGADDHHHPGAAAAVSTGADEPSKR